VIVQHLNLPLNGRAIRVRMEKLRGPAMNAFWFNPRKGEWRVGEAEFNQP